MSRSARSIASTRAAGCSTSSPTSASTAVPANRCVPEDTSSRDDVPDEWEPYTAANVDFFDDLGSPGGASKVGGPTTTRRSSGPPRPWARTEARWPTSGQCGPAGLPGDTIAGARATAAAHPDGLIDLSVGTPVDAVDPLIRDALSAASGFPGYPTTIGTGTARRGRRRTGASPRHCLAWRRTDPARHRGPREAIAGICSTLALVAAIGGHPTGRLPDVMR